MNPAGILIGLLTAAGLLLIVVGLTPSTPDPARPPRRRRPALRARITTRLTRTDLIRLTAGTGAGLILAATTGWLIALPALPALLWGFPKLIAPPKAARLDQLEALEEWTRRLAALIYTGHHLTETLAASLRSCPAPIQPQVDMLVARLQARQSAPAAIYAFADEVDDETGDLIAGALIRGATESGAALGQILADLADMVSHEVHMRRQIAIAQQAPRSEARWVSLISLGLMIMILAIPYGDFYRSPAGQLALLAIMVAFGSVLWWMRTIATPPAIPRWLTRPTDRPSGSLP